MPTTINPSDQTITQYNIQTGGASNLLNNVAPSATSGVPIISQGTSSQPVFGTALVAGGGTGNTTQAAFSLVAGGTTSTGVFQAISPVATGQVLASAGTSALPSFTNTPTVTSITFGAGSALSSYVEAGSFTPAIQFGGASTGITYSTQTGEYTRIGNIVFYTFNIVLTNKGSSTGTAAISGFPISTGGTNNNFNIISYAIITIAVGQNQVVLNPSGTTFSLFTSSLSGAGLSNLTNTQFANGSILQGNGFYFTS